MRRGHSAPEPRHRHGPEAACRIGCSAEPPPETSAKTRQRPDFSPEERATLPPELANRERCSLPQTGLSPVQVEQTENRVRAVAAPTPWSTQSADRDRDDGTGLRPSPRPSTPFRSSKSCPRSCVVRKIQSPWSGDHGIRTAGLVQLPGIECPVSGGTKERVFSGSKNLRE
jgi:hypothetical protein